MSWIDPILEEYYNFLKEKTIVNDDSLSGWVELSTPFTGLFNDTIDIYVKKEGQQIKFSDDGNTIRNLELAGFEISRSAKRKEIFNHILCNYGLRVEDGEIVTTSGIKDFPQKKINMVSAISESYDLQYLAKHSVASIFREDVRLYLDEQSDIVYTPYFISKGLTGLEFTFDFQIAYKKKEIVMKSFNTINKANLPQFLFTWDDIKKAREKQTDKTVVGLAIINDSTEVGHEFLDALESQGAEYILWSQRHEKENMIKLRDVA